MISLFADVLDPRGPSAREIDDLWWLMLGLGTAVFVLFAVLLVLGLRRNRDEADDRPPDAQSRWWLSGGGVALPVVGVLAVLVATLAVMHDSPEQIGDTSLSVEATASQFWWEFRYPGEGDGTVVTASELHIPAGEPVELELISTDVIHSFWVPELAGKRDALPDGPTSITIAADAPGRYAGRCAEFCGLAHAHMDLVVVAHTADDFADWLDTQSQDAAAPTSDEAERGQELFMGAGGCADCHTVRGTDADGEEGPDLTHLMSRERIGAGLLPNTTEDLRRWIHDPGELKEGVDMPPTDLPDDDIAAIVAYLEGLE